MHTRSFCRRSDKNDKTTNFIAIYYTKRRKRFVRFGWERNRFRYNKIYINRRRRPQPAADNAMYICCVGHCFFSLRFSWIGRHRKYAWMANGMQIIVIRRLDFFFFNFISFRVCLAIGTLLFAGNDDYSCISIKLGTRCGVQLNWVKFFLLLRSICVCFCFLFSLNSLINITYSLLALTHWLKW